ncbi:hypothetical protein GDO81_016455 [Engystomops pustulosus]|uniref:Uncharacterized protein n=1 Tax=Engystomops pustulosus TaxID=76066 RepID=A0AAV7B1Y6_ENGPU|nr:hypothetical protein GDO81_016455 [Engystomops pustulosus]
MCQTTPSPTLLCVRPHLLQLYYEPDHSFTNSIMCQTTPSSYSTMCQTTSSPTLLCARSLLLQLYYEPDHSFSNSSMCQNTSSPTLL